MKIQLKQFDYIPVELESVDFELPEEPIHHFFIYIS